MPRPLPNNENAITRLINEHRLHSKSELISNRGLSGIRQTLDLLFPTVCQACGTITAEREAVRRGFCPGCERDLLANDSPSCMGCAAPLPLLDNENPIYPTKDCPVCRGQQWKFEETIALGPYRDLLRHLVLKSKQRTGMSTARALGILLATHRFDRFASWLQQDETMVVPIPSHWTRRIVRGGNSPDAVAEGLAETLGLKARQRLRRVRRTSKQTELPPTRRAANVRSAFKVSNSEKIRGKRILLVDDVFTTGATLSEATRELLRAGAGQVIVVVPAKRIERL